MTPPPKNTPQLLLYPLYCHFETTGLFHAPEYKGALFRGGFGQYFRDLVCVTRAPVCTDCPHLASCAYSLVFETPVRPDAFAVARKYPNAPHPFVLTPPLDSQTVLPPGAPLTLALTLIGSAVERLPHFISVFEAMGRSGRYGGPFRIRKIVAGEERERVIYDGESGRFVKDPLPWRPEPPASVRRLHLQFITPLRMRTEGRYNSRPGFVPIAHALLRRIHLLSAIYGDGSPDAGWMHPLLRQADQVKTERADFRLFAWGRTSGRQGRHIQMDGILGWLSAAGELTELAPHFQIGQWLHVGSGTSMGLGKYIARFEA